MLRHWGEAIAGMHRAAKQDARMDGLADKVEECEAELKRVRSATADAGAQRVDDLELMQAALEAGSGLVGEKKRKEKKSADVIPYARRSKKNKNRRLCY